MSELKKADDIIDNFILYSFIDPTVNLELHDKWQNLKRSAESVETIPMFILEYKNPNSENHSDNKSKERITFLVGLGKERRSNHIDIVIDDTEILYRGNKLKFDTYDENVYKQEFVKLVCQYPELYEKAFM